MYAGEPSSWPVTVSRSRSTMCEIPKSISFTTPSDRIMMFSGLTSRCRIPPACAWASARHDLQDDHRADLGERDRPVGDELLERLAVDELGDDVALGVFLRRVVEDLEDVLVAELRDRLRLALEAIARLLIVGEVLVQDLHRDDALERAIDARDRRWPSRPGRRAPAARTCRGPDQPGSTSRPPP